ncbi:PadR family transcriptional regulator [Photobacterium salinisoli]|uniref:PadR family transcriptional regulator n=1 Tax=Photobacterium salinisoli TaxID=1616783 RepID=UPI000EA0B732|nr:PadR family transcriptional regulator [Photobacterium salinisoli]
MISNLQIVLLSQLKNHCHTGYDITKLIQHSPWKASHQQVYRELARLEASGCVSIEEVLQQGKPDKKVYSLTEAGRKVLADAEGLQPAIRKLQDDASAMLFLKQPGYYQSMKSEIEQRIAAIEAERTSCTDALLLLSLDREKRLLEADAQWCQGVVRAFASGLTQAA